MLAPLSMIDKMTSLYSQMSKNSSASRLVSQYSPITLTQREEHQFIASGIVRDSDRNLWHGRVARAGSPRFQDALVQVRRPWLATVTMSGSRGRVAMLPDFIFLFFRSLGLVLSSSRLLKWIIIWHIFFQMPFVYLHNSYTRIIIQNTNFRFKTSLKLVNWREINRQITKLSTTPNLAFVCPQAKISVKQ